MPGQINTNASEIWKHNPERAGSSQNIDEQITEMLSLRDHLHRTLSQLKERGFTINDDRETLERTHSRYFASQKRNSAA